MKSADGRFLISYNGEIYNHELLRRELEASGVIFRGTSDTEVLVEAFAAWGVERTLGRIRGMFAIALWDVREKQLWLIRDRFGKKPIYYGWIGDAFVFTSELKALRALPRYMPRVDSESARLYFNFGYVPGTRSIFHGIFKLAAGSFLHIDNRSPRGTAPVPIRYWRSEEIIRDGVAHRNSHDDESAIEDLHESLRESVRLRMIADVPLGILLSGGLDSSLVAALMQQQCTERVKTFSIGFEESVYDEAQIAREIADRLGTEHTELYVTPEEAMAVIPKLPLIYDEPFADSSQIPTYLVSEMARRSVIVAMSGDGGDEVFGGYNRYVGGMRMWKFLRRAPGPVRATLSRSLRALSPSVLDWIYAALSTPLPRSFRQRRPGELLHKLARVSSSSDLESFYALLTTTGDALQISPPAKELFSRSQYLSSEAEFDDRDRLMAADTALYLPDDILTKVDRASMSVSLEVRSPLLDHELFEAAWKLPLSLKFRDGVGKWCLRQMLYQYLPRDLMERPKSGFAVPIAAWLRGPLREWTESLISKEKVMSSGIADLSGLGSKQGIQSLWREHLSGGRNREPELWAILMYQAWHDAWAS